MVEIHLNTLQTNFEKSPFWKLIGLQVKEVREGHVELYLPFSPSLLNIQSSVHGGVYASVLDATMGMVGRTLGFDHVLTMQMNVQFLKPVVEGIIYSEATVISQSRSTILAEGKLFDENQNLIAHCTGSFKVSMDK